MVPVICFGDSNGSISVAPTGGVPPFTNSWSTGATTPSITGLPIGFYSDTLTDANGCRYVDASIQVTQPPVVGITLNSITVASCIGQSDGAIDLTGTGGTPGYTYNWTPTGSGSPLQNIPAGTYTVTVTDSHGCTDTLTVTVGTAPPLMLTAQVHNILCPPLHNGWISLTVSGGTPGYAYAWSNGSTSGYLDNLSVGPEQLIVTDSRGCTKDSSFVIINDSSFHVRPTPDTVTINEGDETQLGLDITSATGDAVASISWIPTRYLSCTNCTAPIAAPVQTTNYSVHAVSDSGCIEDVKVLVTVIPQHQLYIPNAFTPNGNGTNDVWEIFGNKKAWKAVDAQIFDRWGEKIFESTDINFTWDGKYRGQLVEPGVYVYTVKVTFVDGNTVSNKGSITIIR
jgi:gliding motility-associated-like protein